MARVTLAAATDVFPNGARVVSITSGDVADATKPVSDTNPATNVATVTTITTAPDGSLPPLAAGTTVAQVWPGATIQAG